MAGAWPGAQHMGPLPGFLSPSQSACVKGRNPEKVLECWAAATSTALLLLSAFLSICKDFSQGQTFQPFTVFYFYFISCLLNGLRHCAPLFAQHLPVNGRVKAQRSHRHGKPWPLGLRWFQVTHTGVHVLWYRSAPHTSLPAARMMESHSECQAARTRTVLLYQW